jgi:hypothetical protein
VKVLVKVRRPPPSRDDACAHRPSSRAYRRHPLRNSPDGAAAAGGCGPVPVKPTDAVRGAIQTVGGAGLLGPKCKRKAPGSRAVCGPLLLRSLSATLHAEARVAGRGDSGASAGGRWVRGAYTVCEKGSTRKDDIGVTRARAGEELESNAKSEMSARGVHGEGVTGGAIPRQTQTPLRGPRKALLQSVAAVSCQSSVSCVCVCV